MPQRCPHQQAVLYAWCNPLLCTAFDYVLALAQAAKEVAHLQSSQVWSTKSQGPSSASTDLPIWQEQALTHLNLWGPNANLEVMLGGVPPVDPRLLAAVRILYCKDPSELQGRALVQLGAWGAFLNPANEVYPFTGIIWAVCSSRHQTRGQIQQTMMTTHDWAELHSATSIAQYCLTIEVAHLALAMYALHHMPPVASGPTADLLHSHIAPWLAHCTSELYEPMVHYFLQVRALRTIAAICTMLLSQWSSVPQEDQEALSLGMDSAGLPLSSDMKLAMQFRLEKKCLLLHAVNEISKQIQVSDRRCA